MKWIYNIGVGAMHLGIRMASPFNEKARLATKGRKGVLDRMKAVKGPCIWMHCASLGEYEQGKPVLEALKLAHPDHALVVTFFSPSGYEVRKNTEGISVFYLPASTKANARKLLETLDVRLAIFVKYEFWFPYLEALHAQRIPTYLIAAVFRKGQPFFKSYGGAWRTMLGFFDKIYVQQEASISLLQTIDVKHVEVGGDPRFDRVLETAVASEEIPTVAAFCTDRKVLVMGSSWPAEEQLLEAYVSKAHSPKWCYIIAPHDIRENHIEAIAKQFSKHLKVQRFSHWKADEKADVLIIDNIGMLAALYRYGDVAVIGGAFGKGLHNILEAAAFDLPVIFGPNHQRFPEGQALIDGGGASAISDDASFYTKLKQLIEDEAFRKQTGKNAGTFIAKHKGATNKIVSELSSRLS